VFRTTIVKTFHVALDVMFDTARYKIACKRFVACGANNSDKFEFRGWQQNSYRRAPLNASSDSDLRAGSKKVFLTARPTSEARD